MLRAGSRRLDGWLHGGSLLACCVALTGGGCAVAAPLGGSPSSPAKQPAAERLQDEEQGPGDAAVTPEQQSELEALDLDLREASKQLEQQLLRKQGDDRVAERRAAEKNDAKARDGKRKEAGPPPKKQPGGGGAQAGPDTKPAATPSMDLDEAQDTTLALRGAPCDLGCRALKSMQNSAARICELAGKGSSRCLRATEMVTQAAERVRAAGCQCSGDNGELMSRVDAGQSVTSARAVACEPAS